MRNFALLLVGITSFGAMTSCSMEHSFSLRERDQLEGETGGTNGGTTSGNPTTTTTAPAAPTTTTTRPSTTTTSTTRPSTTTSTTLSPGTTSTTTSTTTTQAAPTTTTTTQPAATTTSTTTTSTTTSTGAPATTTTVASSTTTTTSGQASCEETATETFQQPTETRRKLDILFVTDTSGSLDDERLAVANGIGSFVSQLPAGTDFQVGVMLAHAASADYSGKLYRYGSNPYVLTSAMSASDLQTRLRQNLTNGPGEGVSDGGEAMLTSYKKAVTAGSTQLAFNQSKGFFRADAALAVIFISDENDVCYPGRVRDPDGGEENSFNLYCSGVNADSVVQATRSLKGNVPFLFAGIVYTGSVPVPAVNENELGLGIIETVNLANGLLVDMAVGQFADGLRQIGELSRVLLELRTEFTLSGTPVAGQPFTVRVDSLSVPYTYAPSLNQIQLSASNAGSAGSTIEITYCTAVSGP